MRQAAIRESRTQAGAGGLSPPSFQRKRESTTARRVPVRRASKGSFGSRERGRPARNALARVTLTLALSHKGRGDPLAGIYA